MWYENFKFRSTIDEEKEVAKSSFIVLGSGLKCIKKCFSFELRIVLHLFNISLSGIQYC